jgi:hypothetical protein
VNEEDIRKINEVLLHRGLKIHKISANNRPAPRKGKKKNSCRRKTGVKSRPAIPSPLLAETNFIQMAPCHYSLFALPSARVSRKKTLFPPFGKLCFLPPAHCSSSHLLLYNVSSFYLFSFYFFIKLLLGARL